MSEMRLVTSGDAIPYRSLQDSHFDMFSATAIGSCRIIGPMRLMQKTEPMILNQSGVYGYSHSCTEVRQHLAHILNGTRPPRHLMPVLAPGMTSDIERETLHKPSDFYVFELSSAKRVSVDGHPVQLNYLNRHFREFFSDTARTRAFWGYAKKHDQSKMREFLSGISEYDRLPSEDQEILQKTELRMTDPDQLRLDIDAIRASAPNHLFVTHFDAISKDGTQLKARADYLKMTRQALTDCGVLWYDPSQSVAAFGQNLALDDPSRSLSHFSYSFEQHLCADWWMRFLCPVRDSRRMNAGLRHRVQQAAIMHSASALTSSLST